MVASSFTSAKYLLRPCLFLSMALFAIYNVHNVSDSWVNIISDVFPVLSLFTGFFLSIHFNKSRYSLVIVFLTLIALTLLMYRSDINETFIHCAFILTFLNLTAFSFLEDRALLSIHGFIRLSIITIQVIPLIYATQHYSEVIENLLWSNIYNLPDAINIYPPFNVLPDISILVASLCCTLHLSATIIKNSPIQASFFGCQASLFILITLIGSTPLIFTTATIILCCSLIIIIAIVLDSYDMAYKDELTGLPSRRALNQSLLGLGKKYSVAMLDIDHFKKFNDTHGHDVGDEVLRMVASKIATITGGGKPFRYGGEEFTIIFPRKNKDEIESHLDALRESIENYKMVIRSKQRPKKSKDNKQAKNKRGKDKNAKKTLSVTISIGYSDSTTKPKQPEEIIKAADLALYRAKKKGRNCIST